MTPTLNTTSSLGISAEGAARRVIGFVRENSTVLDVGGHLGIFSEAIISMYNEKFSNTFLNIGIFEPRYLFYLCQIERMAILDDPKWEKKKRFTHPNTINMEFFNFALGEKDYETKTLLVSPDGNTEDNIPSGWNTLLEVDPLANDDGIDDWKAKMDHEYVLIRSLSSVIHSLNQKFSNDVSVIKIDVEGFEGMVIRGALPWLRQISLEKKILPIFIVEVGWGIERHPQAEANTKTYRELVSIGYCDIVLPRTFTTDVLFIPRSIDPTCSKHQLWEGGRL